MTRNPGGQVETAREALLPLGPAIIPTALQVYPHLRGFKARTALVNTAMKFPLVEPGAITLALTALEGRSAAVRYRACMLLAVAGRKDTISALERLRDHGSEDSRADAGAAIRVNRGRNQNLFLDRDDTGRVRMNVGGLVHPDR